MKDIWVDVYVYGKVVLEIAKWKSTFIICQLTPSISVNIGESKLIVGGFSCNFSKKR